MKDIDFKKQILDNISPSFCGAKWYNATIWLGSGMTTSCHHPPAHKIDIEKVNSLGIQISDKQEGEFILEIKYIKAIY